MTSEEIRERVKKLLTKERYRHTINVQKIAVNLAKRYNCDIKKVSLAALLHDVAKCFSYKKSLKIINTYKTQFDRLELEIPKIWHAKISAIVAKEKFGIKDNAILKAIRMHTTGGTNMSLIDKIIYIADILDISKNIKGVEKVKKALKKSIDAGLKEAIRLKLFYLIKRDLEIHPDSFKAWNSLF